jgi:hypothetical protein
MIVSLFTVTALALGQVSDTPSYGIPYEFTMNDGKTIYGLARISDVQNDRKIRFNIRIEEPWFRRVEIRLMKKNQIQDSNQEGEATYRRRIKTEWARNGGRKIGTPQDPRWILETEYQLARSALAMANPVDAASAETADTVADDALSQESGSVGLIQQWWIHVVIGIAALALVVASIWWGFLRRNWSDIGA